MRIVGVLDLLGGRAVHAQGGCRLGYAPVGVVAETPVNGDPAALARVYVDQLELDECYLADLDAIAGGAGHEQEIRRVASLGMALWLDTGVSTVAQARRARSLGAARVIVGLETLTSFESLSEIATAIGTDAVVFSLDLRDGRPIAAPALAELPIETLAARAAGAGSGAIIVLDLARVGSGRGLDWQVIECVRRAAPDVTLLAGGGVRDAEDLKRLASAGCDGALVATALHGAGGADLVRAARNAIGHAKVTR